MNQHIAKIVADYTPPWWGDNQGYWGTFGDRWYHRDNPKPWGSLASGIRARTPSPNMETFRRSCREVEIERYQNSKDGFRWRKMLARAAEARRLDQNTLERKHAEAIVRIEAVILSGRGMEGSFAGRISAAGDNPVGAYLQEAIAAPLLSREEEVALAKLIVAGRADGHTKADWVAGRQARDQIIRSSLRLVVSIAKKYPKVLVPFLELIQEGNWGLMKAVDKFDHTRGTRFSTHATYWIKDAIKQSIENEGRASFIQYDMTKSIPVADPGKPTQAPTATLAEQHADRQRPTFDFRDYLPDHQAVDRECTIADVVDGLGSDATPGGGSSKGNRGQVVGDPLRAPTDYDRNSDHYGQGPRHVQDDKPFFDARTRTKAISGFDPVVFDHSNAGSGQADQPAELRVTGPSKSGLRTFIAKATAGRPVTKYPMGKSGPRKITF